MNNVKLHGRLTRDPEVSERSETKVCDMRLAVNGAGKAPTLFIDVVAFGELAESSGELKKGTEVDVDRSAPLLGVGDEAERQVQNLREALQALGDRSASWSPPSGQCRDDHRSPAPEGAGLFFVRLSLPI